jgi:tRNA-binding EMAP/Myf-like protein
VIITAGAVVGCVSGVDDHPDGQRIWLAKVDLGSGALVQIVFGGRYKVRPGELVPVAPPGARGMVLPTGSLSVPRYKKMRNRRYRGQRSHGMLCSLDELGWAQGGPDEVAILHGLNPGDSLDNIRTECRADIVVRNQDALLPVTVEQEVADMVDMVFDPSPAAQPSV